MAAIRMSISFWVFYYKYRYDYNFFVQIYRQGLFTYVNQIIVKSDDVILKVKQRNYMEFSFPFFHLS